MSKYVINIPSDIFTAPTIRNYDDMKEEIEERLKDEIREEIMQEVRDEVQSTLDAKFQDIDNIIDSIRREADDVKDKAQEVIDALDELEGETTFAVEDCF